MKIQLLIAANSVFEPVVLDGVTWATERKGAPGKLEFTVVKDEFIAFEHGNRVQLKVDGKPVFMGFIFEKNRDKNQQIHVVAYDQLRYLKNKETYYTTNKKASDMLRMIAQDFNLKTGTIEDTGYTVPLIAQDNNTLFDIMQHMLDLTVINNKKSFCLFDNFGKLELRNIENMKSDIIIDPGTAQDYDYGTNIDTDTYNHIKLYRDNNKTGKRDVYEVRDNNNIGNWGVLKLSESLQEGENGQAKAEAYLKLKNRVSRSLSVRGCFGDLSVRAGASVYFSMNLGDKIINNYLVCERVTHFFSANNHIMDIDLIGNNLIWGG